MPFSWNTAAENSSAAITARSTIKSALELLETVIEDHRDEARFSAYAESDLRVLSGLHQDIESQGAAESAKKWLRQIALSWNTRLQGVERFRFRRLFALLDGAAVR